MRHPIAWLRDMKPQTRLLLAVGVVLLVTGSAVAVELTSRPAFCNTCHEMTPYYEAWTAGAHATVDCVDCHVDPGVVAQVSHKFVALKEVYLHLTTDPRFPVGAEVPDRRCVACHDDEVDPRIPGFDHEAHRAGRQCVSCHSGIGHTVTAEALDAAGVLDPEAFAAYESSRTAVLGAGAANIEGHVEVVCSDCHDLAATGCAACHPRPEEHPETTATCLTCHAAADWRFEHPPASAACAACHEPPDDHYPQPCTTCHETGVSWAFTHPTSADCASCHAPPADHYGSSCASCHSPDEAWSDAVFTHPGSASACLECHTKPAGHYSTSCASCHKTGVSWAFTHPTSAACASCHRPPANHYGSSCASCHSPSRAWSSATFSHPRVPGGEHTYRSFSCATCHPRGYSTYSCLECHSSNDPDDDDDD